MQLLSRSKFLAQFPKNLRSKILGMAEKYQADFIVMFENVMLDSSHCGDRTACAVGPANTFKTLEELEGRWLGDLPSRRLYPQNYMVCK